MPDTKITALTAIGANPIIPATFPIPMVDLTDTSMAASGTTKKVTVNQILGAGGTATLASATISGDLTVDTSTFKVDSTNDRVGFGTATPAAKLDVASSNNAFNAIQARYNSSNPLIGFGIANSNGYGYLGFNTKPKSSSDTMTYELTNSATQLRMDAGQFRFNIAASGTAGNDITFTTAATIDASGNLTVANGNVILGTSGKGIDFSATANSSGTMTSELLNDYEEGTFTPTVIGTTFFNTATYSRQLGRYTKVGNLVTIQIYLAWSAGTGVGNLAFYGLPFNIANNANEYATATIGFLDSVALTASNIPTIIGAANGTMLELWQFPVGGGVSNQVPYDGNGSIILTSTYIAA